MCGNAYITHNSNNITNCFRGADGDFCDSVTAHCLLKPYASTLPVSTLLVSTLPVSTLPVSTLLLEY